MEGLVERLLIDEGMETEGAALDEAIRAYVKRWGELNGDNGATPQGWVVVTEFTSFELIDSATFGALRVSPNEQMNATSLGLSLQAVNHYTL